MYLAINNAAQGSLICEMCYAENQFILVVVNSFIINKIKTPEWGEVEKLYGQQMDAGHNFTIVCIKYSKFLNFLISIIS